MPMDDEKSIKKSEGPTANRYGYHGHHHKGGAMVTAGSHDVADPVCGMMIDPHLTEHRTTFGRKTFHFCSTACLSRFEASPASFAN